VEGIDPPPGVNATADSAINALARIANVRSLIERLLLRKRRRIDA
jgi:hypothetical protein